MGALAILIRYVAARRLPVWSPVLVGAGLAPLALPRRPAVGAARPGSRRAAGS